jgi:hypothetical protein
MNLFGIVRVLGSVQSFENTEFKKRTIIVESVESKTPYSVDFINNKIQTIDDLLLGSFVKIEVNIKGNYDKKDKTRVYNSFEAKNLIVLDSN